MKKFLVLLSVLLIVGSRAGIAGATFIEIDFEGLTKGEVVTDQYADLGVTFALLDTPSGYVSGPVANNINGSPFPSIETGIALNPGNNGRDPFYDIEILFSTAIDYFSFFSLDSDEKLTVNGYMDNLLVESQFYPGGSDRQEWHLELGEIGNSQRINRVVLDVVSGPGSSGVAGGPELYDNLSFNTAPVPEPSTIILLGAGLAGLFAYRRKKR